jgi:hypothetical protein
MGYVRRKCTRCVNGYIMTGFGPKPCPYCNTNGYIDYWVDDRDDYEESKPSYSSYSDDDDDDSSDEKKDTTLKFRPFGCLISSVILYVVIKNALLPADWDQGGPYLFCVLVFVIVMKLSIK